MANPAFPAAPWMIDLSDRAKLRFTGADRVRFLNGQVSNDVRRATGAQAVYACVMTLKGKMGGDVWIHAGDDCLLLDAPAELRESLAARLERYIIADDVTLEDVTDEFPLFHLAGVSAANEPGAVAANRFGQPGVDLWRAPSSPPPVITPAQAETVRIAAGIPRWGAELDENTMPAEAGLEERAVDFAKGCYIGQEVVSRVKSVGHVNWALRGICPADGALLAPGQTFLSPDGSGKTVARVTSVAPSLDGAGQIALGYVRRGFETPGTILHRDSARATVCALPFSL